MTDPLTKWHQFIADRDVAHLDQLLDDHITFSSPAYWKPRTGKPTTLLILSAVMEIFEDFKYRRQWIHENDWALEFTARIGDLGLKGVDLITLQDGKITELEVVIRPPNAVETLRQEMAVRLATQGAADG